MEKIGGWKQVEMKKKRWLKIRGDIAMMDGRVLNIRKGIGRVKVWKRGYRAKSRVSFAINTQSEQQQWAISQQTFPRAVDEVSHETFRHRKQNAAWIRSTQCFVGFFEGACIMSSNIFQQHLLIPISLTVLSKRFCQLCSSVSITKEANKSQPIIHREWKKQRNNEWGAQELRPEPESSYAKLN